MSIIECTSEARCLHCRHHRTAALTKKDGTKSRRWVGHCFLSDPPKPVPARHYACKDFVPYWQPTTQSSQSSQPAQQ